MHQDIEAFLAHHRGLSENTLQAYRTDIRQFRDFVARRGRAEWQDCGEEDVAAFGEDLRSRSYAPATVTRRLRVVALFSAFLVSRSVIHQGFAEALEGPGLEHSPSRILTPEQVEIMHGRVQKEENLRWARILAIQELILATGLRVGELIQLDITDVDLDNRRLRCKGQQRRARDLSLTDEAVRALKFYLDKVRPQFCRSRTETAETALWLNQRGKRFTRYHVWKHTKEYGAMLGIPDMTPQLLRDTFIAYAQSKGAGAEEKGTPFGLVMEARTED